MNGRFDLNTDGVDYGVIEFFGADYEDLAKPVIDNVRQMTHSNVPGFSMLAFIDFFRLLPTYIIGMVTSANREREVQSWGVLREMDLRSPADLVPFLARALATYNDVEHIALGFKGHGEGLSGQILQDVTSRRGLRIDQVTEALDMAFEETIWRARPDRKIDILFADVCSCGWVEVLEQARRHAHVLISSEGEAPDSAWDYEAWLDSMERARPVDAEGWARQAVRSYKPGARQYIALAAFRTENRIAEAFRNVVIALRALGDDGYRLLNAARQDLQPIGRTTVAFDLVQAMNALLLETKASGSMPAHSVEAVRKACQALKDEILGEERARLDITGVDGADSLCGLAFWFPGTLDQVRALADRYERLEFNRVTGWLDYVSDWWSEPTRRRWERRLASGRRRRRPHALRVGQ